MRAKAVENTAMPFRNQLILLVLLVVEASSNNVIVSPGDAVKGARAVISFAEHQTTQDRRDYLHMAKEQGYTCWMFPDYHSAAICIQVSFEKIVDINEREAWLLHTNPEAWPQAVDYVSNDPDVYSQ